MPVATALQATSSRWKLIEYEQIDSHQLSRGLFDTDKSP